MTTFRRFRAIPLRFRAIPAIPWFRRSVKLEPVSTGEKFERAVSIMARLRAPGGCPWDREQTFATIAPFTIEGLPSNINTIGFSFKWDVWDWGNKKHLMDEKQRGIEQSRLNLTETQTQVAIDVSNRYRKLREGRAGLKVAQMAEEAEQQKLAVIMHKYQQMDYKQIADVLKKSESATKSLLFRAYETLREQLKEFI